MCERAARPGTTTTAPQLTWSCTLPASASQVREARRWLARILDGSPAADDAILCLSELATNAVTHSSSGQLGGSFTIRADIRHGDRVRVEVEDEGGPWSRPVCADEQHGRGLVIVGTLARDWGISGHSYSGWTVWAEIAVP